MKKLILAACFSLIATQAFAQFRGGPSHGPDRGDNRGGPGHGGPDHGWPGPRPGPEPRPSPVSSICFYENINYSGQSFCVQDGAQVPNLGSSGWNDRISSIAIQGNASVVVYQDINYGGQAITINQSVADIRAFGAVWNDFISSLYVTGGHPTPPSTARVCFYQDINYAGRSFCLTPGQYQADLAQTGWNDAISSVSIEGDASVFVYQNANYTGQNVLISRSVPDIRQAGSIWNDLVSSMNVVHANGRP